MGGGRRTKGLFVICRDAAKAILKPRDLAFQNGTESVPELNASDRAERRAFA
jgi:hypothetical protein